MCKHNHKNLNLKLGYMSYIIELKNSVFINAYNHSDEWVTNSKINPGGSRIPK